MHNIATRGEVLMLIVLFLTGWCAGFISAFTLFA